MGSTVEDRSAGAGEALYSLLLSQQQWVAHRRETFEFLDDAIFRKSITVDLDLPSAGFLPRRCGVISLGYFIRDARLSELHIEDAAGSRVPRIAESLSRRLIAEVAVSLASRCLPAPCSSPFAQEIEGILTGPDRPRSLPQLEEAVSELHPFWGSFLRNGPFSRWATAVLEGWFLLIPADDGYRAVTFSYVGEWSEEKFFHQPNELFGWAGTNFSLMIPNLGEGATFELVVRSPPGFHIVDWDWRPREFGSSVRCDAVKTPSAISYAFSEARPGDRAEVMVSLGPVGPGLVRRVTMAAFGVATIVTLAWTLGLERLSEMSNMTSLLLAAAGFFSFASVRTGENPLLSRRLAWFRAVSAVSGATAVAAAVQSATGIVAMCIDLGFVRLGSGCLRPALWWWTPSHGRARCPSCLRSSSRCGDPIGRLHDD